MATTPQTGFSQVTPYVAPNMTSTTGMGNHGFFRPADSTMPTGAALDSFMMPSGAATTAEQVANRTVKMDGGLTREQIGNVGEALSGQIGTVNQNLGTGFTQIGDGLSTVNKNVTDGIGAVNTNLNTVNNNMNTGLTGINTAVAAGNTAQAAGFADQKAALDKMNNQAATYFDSLNKGQAAAATQVGALQSGFSAFNNQYGQDTTRQDQNMTRLQSSMDGQFEQQGKQIAQGQSAVDTQAANIMAAVGGGAGGAHAKATMTPQNPGGQPGQASPGATAPVSPIAQTANMARQIMQSMGQSLDPATASQVSSFAMSFDEGGNLIPRTQNPDGSFVVRSLGQDGTVNITGVDAMGGVRQGALNVNQALGMINQIAQPAPFRSA